MSYRDDAESWKACAKELDQKLQAALESDRSKAVKKWRVRTVFSCAGFAVYMFIATLCRASMTKEPDGPFDPWHPWLALTMLAIVVAAVLIEEE